MKTYNKLIALVAAFGLVGVSYAQDAGKISDNLSLAGFVDASYSASEDGATQTDGIGIDEVEIDFLFGFGSVSAEVHVDSTGGNLSVEQAFATYDLGHGFSGKVKIKVNYKENKDGTKKWDFCKFASEQVKYGLRTHLYQLNINRQYGKLPDNDTVRKLYYILPKFKFDNPLLDRESRYTEISKKYNIDIEDIKLVDKFITQKTTSFDAPINSEDEDQDELSQIIPDDESTDQENVGPALRDINNQEAYNKFKGLTQTFLKNLPSRESEILERTKIKEDTSFIKLSKKFNISAERVRQIAESNFEKFKLFIIKHKKDLERIL